MLAAGGSKHYSELLAPFGLDARDPGFWQIGLGMVEGLIGELESLKATPEAGGLSLAAGCAGLRRSPD